MDDSATGLLRYWKVVAGKSSGSKSGYISPKNDQPPKHSPSKRRKLTELTGYLEADSIEESNFRAKYRKCKVEAYRGSPILNSSSDIHESVPKDNENLSDACFSTLLSLPFDIISSIMDHLGEDEILCLFQTCRALQPHSSRLWLARTQVLDTTCASTRIRTRERISNNTFVLLSYLLQHESPSIILDCDLVSICTYHCQMSNFLSYWGENIVSVEVSFSEDSSLSGSTASMAKALLLVLGSLTSSCSSITIKHESTFAVKPQTQRRKTIKLKQPLQYYKSRLQRTMTSVTMLHISLALFQANSSLLSLILSALLSGPTVNYLNLTCPNHQQYHDFIFRANYPLLHSFHARINNSCTIKLDNGFLARHPNLEDLSILNAISQRRGSPELQTPSCSIKLPGSLHHAHISANYTGLTMDDMPLLSSFTIQPVYRLIRPPTELYCEAIRSVTSLILASSHLCFSPYLTFSIRFPEDLSRHIHAFKRGAGYCRCPPNGVHESIINIHSLELNIDILDDSFQDYLQKWLGWFPKLRSLKLIYERLSQEILPEKLVSLRRVCNDLSIFAYSNDLGLGSSQITWTFEPEGGKRGSWSRTEW